MYKGSTTAVRGTYDTLLWAGTVMVGHRIALVGVLLRASGRGDSTVT